MNIVRTALALCGAIACGGCTGNTEPDTAEDARPKAERIEVAIAAKSGSAVVGKAILEELPNGVRIVVRVSGIEPGLHGVHVHEIADCSADDGSSAGGHFNPEGHVHGLPPHERHLGDLGNIGAKNPDGKGLLEVVVPGATLEPYVEHSFVGRAIIVHEDVDRGVQPAGMAGARVGCGEIVTERRG